MREKSSQVGALVVFGLVVLPRVMMILLRRADCQFCQLPTLTNLTHFLLEGGERNSQVDQIAIGVLDMCNFDQNGCINNLPIS